MSQPFNLDQLLETGEPDQDYDHAFYDQVVAQLEAEGFEASHRECDKYQGVYIKVRGIGLFWHHSEMGYDRYNYGRRACFPMACDGVSLGENEGEAHCTIFQDEEGRVDFCAVNDTRGVRYDRLAQELIRSTDTSKGPEHA
jgi:hypothetical protein